MPLSFRDERATCGASSGRQRHAVLSSALAVADAKCRRCDRLSGQGHARGNEDADGGRAGGVAVRWRITTQRPIRRQAASAIAIGEQIRRSWASQNGPPASAIKRIVPALVLRRPMATRAMPTAARARYRALPGCERLRPPSRRRAHSRRSGVGRQGTGKSRSGSSPGRFTPLPSRRRPMHSAC